MSFKGEKVGVSHLEILQAGTPRLSFKIHYLDDEGRVHGIMKHEIGLDVLGDTAKNAASTLIKEVSKWARGVHFSQPVTKEAASGPAGIAEALQQVPDPYQDPEDQG